LIYNLLKQNISEAKQKWNVLVQLKAAVENGPEHAYWSCEDRSQTANAEMDQNKHFRSSRLQTKERSSVEERYIDIVEVVSSILSAPIYLLGDVSKFFDVIRFSVDQVFWLNWGNREAFFCLAAPSCCNSPNNLSCKATALTTQ
jgi:hypothetical protein